MKKLIVLFCFILFSLAALTQDKAPKFTIMPVVSWNQEKLDWNIAGDENGQNPNILSELKWRKIRGAEIGFSSTVALSSLFRATIAIRHFWINQGVVNDSDYASDNRAVKTADDNFKADQGHATNIRAELSYPIRTNEKFALRTHVGYFGRYQTLYMLDGPQPLVEGKVLKSTYKPRWHGLILGLNTDYRMDSWNFHMDISGLYFPRYSANANWNLQEDFNHPISFTHKASGMGWESASRAPSKQRILPFFTDQLYWNDNQNRNRPTV